MPVLIAVIIEDMAALCSVDFVDKSGKPGVFSLPVHLYAPVHHTHTHSHTHTDTHTHLFSPPVHLDAPVSGIARQRLALLLL
jgi:hypothetical protein